MPNRENLPPWADWKRWLPRLVIIVPTLLMAVYYAWVANVHYLVESKVAVKNTNDHGMSSSPLGSLFSGISVVSQEDPLRLKEYMLSLDMLQHLERELKLREVFSASKMDIFYYLPKDAPLEWFLDYYRSRVKVDFDMQTGILTVKTEAFDPDFTQRLNEAILAESNRFINEVSKQIARGQLDFATHEVEAVRKRLDAVKDKELAFQNQYGSLDPLAQAEAESRLVMELEARQAQMETELRTMQTYLNSDSIPVISAKNALESLQAQIAREKSKLTVPGNGRPDSGKMNEMALKFMSIKGELEYTVDLYKTALVALETSRIEAARQSKELVVIASPYKPEQTDWMRKLKNLGTLLFLSVLLSYLVKLALAVIEDHRD